MEKILITGNGFDINLGWKTAYSDFLQSEQFLKIVDSNTLAKYLNEVGDIQKWVDVEHELKNYAVGLHSHGLDFHRHLIPRLHLNVSSDAVVNLKEFPQSYINNFHKRLDLEHTNFAKYFVELKVALQEYLINASNKNFINTKSNAHILLTHGQLFDVNDNYIAQRLNSSRNKSLFELQPFNQVYSLNFTSYNSIETHFPAFPVVMNMHGSLANGDMVFGIEDQVPKLQNASEPDKDPTSILFTNYQFLWKSHHSAFGKAPDLQSLLNGEAKDFHFFGLSFGDTDNAHFSGFFKKLSVMESTRTDRHKLNFYVYGSEGYQSTMNRIVTLVDGNLSRFKLNSEVKFYDIKNNCVVNQTYLNDL